MDARSEPPRRGLEAPVTPEGSGDRPDGGDLDRGPKVRQSEIVTIGRKRTDCILSDDHEEPQRNRMPRCEFDALLGSDAGKHDGVDPARSQSLLKGRTDKERRGALLNDQLVACRNESVDELDFVASGLHVRPKLCHATHMLASHQNPQAHARCIDESRRYVLAPHDRRLTLASAFDQSQYVLANQLGVLGASQDADLHVPHDQRARGRIEQFVKPERRGQNGTAHLRFATYRLGWRCASVMTRPLADTFENAQIREAEAQKEERRGNVR